MRRSELMTDSGDYKGALKGYHKVLTLSEADGPVYIEVAKKIAGIHFKCNELDQAYNVLMSAFSKFNSIVTTAGNYKIVCFINDFPKLFSFL
jgi:hypothetical protein